MHFAGVVPEDAPDPRIAAERSVETMPVAVRGFVPQPALEDGGAYGVSTATDGEGAYEMSVSIGYTLWRNPADHSDPINLVELDDDARQALDMVPPWPRPAWVIAAAERLRYPQLWEAVRTTWQRPPARDAALSRLLVDHARYILVNRFREEAGIDGADWDSPALPGEATVRSGVYVRIDGEEVTGVEIDTDPFVYAVGAELPGGGVLTVVVPRDDLPSIELAFAVRTGSLAG